MLEEPTSVTSLVVQNIEVSEAAILMKFSMNFLYQLVKPKKTSSSTKTLHRFLYCFGVFFFYFEKIGVIKASSLVKF